ncbi:hypothetical protein E2P71_02540 [Candidatus Bathyarchaeota archaeon]|nr:hypothetical protein E2P71_02540 [Candidatus Bathyarchaeota archaeon]
MSSITIADITAKPNSKTRGYLDIGEPEYNIPFVIINGANKGKTIAVLGGVHGTEHPGVEAIIRLTQTLDPAQLSGTVIAVPVVNTPQFLGHSQFTSPVDGLNLNSEFPGAPEGSLTQRIAHKVFTQIVSKCDTLIDCHGGDVDENINGFVVASSSGDPTLDRISLEMASCYDSGLVHVFPSEEKGMSNSAQRIYEIPCIQPEAGTPFPVREEAVQFHLDGIINVLRYFQMLPGEPKRYHQLVSPRRLKLFSEHNGIWESHCQLDQRVEKGETLGVVKNYFGDTIQTIHAPEAGIVSMMRCYYAVKLEELLLVVSTLA